MVKCSKVKNQCKICLESVTTKTGLQCMGACKKWVHFDCLNFTPGKIQDIKNGVIQINCPCPTCNTTMPKEFLTDPPYTCKNKTCPATQPPRCEETKCPSNDPVPELLASSKGSSPPSVSNDSPSQSDTEDSICCRAYRKPAPTLENKSRKPETFPSHDNKSGKTEEKPSPENKPRKPEACALPEKKLLKTEGKSSPVNKTCKPDMCTLPEKKPGRHEQKPDRHKQKPNSHEQKQSLFSPDLCCVTAKKCCCNAEPHTQKEIEDSSSDDEKFKKKTHSDSQLSLNKVNNKALLSVLQNLCNTIGELSKQVQKLLSNVGEKEKPKSVK